MYVQRKQFRVIDGAKRIDISHQVENVLFYLGELLVNYLLCHFLVNLLVWRLPLLVAFQVEKRLLDVINVNLSTLPKYLIHTNLMQFLFHVLELLLVPKINERVLFAVSTTINVFPMETLSCLELLL